MSQVCINNLNNGLFYNSLFFPTLISKFLCILISKQTGLLELTKKQDWATTFYADQSMFQKMEMHRIIHLECLQLATSRYLPMRHQIKNGGAQNHQFAMPTTSNIHATHKAQRVPNMQQLNMIHATKKAYEAFQ